MTSDDFRQSLTATEPPAGPTLGVELRAKCTPMEDAVAVRADDTACQSATDDRHQQCEHGIAVDYIIPRYGKSQV